jgi:uncharacterized membrane protein
MVSLRSHRKIAAPVDRIWSFVGDSEALPTWFRSIASCAVSGDLRVCQLARGGEVRERIVTRDEQLRRFQYSITEGIPVTSHLGSIDVLDVGPGASVVVYSTDAEPDTVGAQIGAAVERALDDLVALFETDPRENSVSRP